MQLLRVTQSIYCIRRLSYLTCSYLVMRPDGITLVDAGMASDASDVLAALETLGAKPEFVNSILLTHWHGDHSAGAETVRRRSGARTFAHEREAPYFSRDPSNSGWKGRLSFWVPEAGPLVLLKGVLGDAAPARIESLDLARDGELIAGGFRVLETPGHTPGHLSYFYEPEGILFCGDAAAVVGDRIRRMAAVVTPDQERARVSMIRCLETDFAHLCPGHRRPLIGVSRQHRQDALSRLSNSARWPLFG